MAEAGRGALGLAMEGFEQAWKADLRSRGIRPVEGVWLPSYKLRGADVLEEAEEAEDQVLETLVEVVVLEVLLLNG